MNPALLIHEIFFVIVYFVRVDLWMLKNPTLAALARTCRAFKEPALDMLWFELDDLSPLVRCLPRDSWNDDREESITPLVYSFTRPLTETEWCTLQGYTRRIRALKLHWPHKTLDETAIRVLCNRLCNRLTTDPLFPNIQLIFWSDPTRERFSFIRSLVGQETTSLTIKNWGKDWGTGELAILATLTARCPKMKIVCLPDSDSIQLSNGISGTLCGWDSLTDVDCDVIEETTMLHLGGLRSLTSLSFVLERHDALSRSTQPFVGMFTSLSSLVVTTTRMDDIRLLMLRLRVQLKSLEVSVETCPEQREVKPFLLALEQSCSRDHLRSIDILHTFSTLHQARHLPLTIDDFSPLTFFSNLKEIYFDTGCQIELDGSDILELASAWQCLTTLSLNERHGWRTCSGISPLDLLPLIRKCPQLKTLTVMLNSESLSTIPLDQPGCGFSSDKLLHLDVLDSQIKDKSVAPLAALLSDLFPKLDYIRHWIDAMCGRRADVGQQPVWWRVNEALKQFSMVRNQERRFKEHTNGGAWAAALPARG
ncbi:hypothetical protein BU15DRAFT_67817 [Melanogaster broomeanus]|nr:hypothetical protein BU15DRAFT_67817 [Melanogaster broomeanus]